MYKTTTTINPDNFWKRLNLVFASRGIVNQKEWCREHDINYSTLKNAQYTNAVPTMDFMVKYCQLLDCSIDYLLFGKDSKNNDALLSDRAKDIAVAFDKADESTKAVILRLLNINSIPAC